MLNRKETINKILEKNINEKKEAYFKELEKLLDTYIKLGKQLYLK